MKNPLNKRLPRELRQDAGKFIALFLFLVATIGFVSGFLVADSSMKHAYDNSFDDYLIEDGHFALAAQAEPELINNLESEDIAVYNLFYKDKTLENEHVWRIYANRQNVNRVSVLDGCLPQEENEIAIDRLYAENNDIALHDSVIVEGKSFTVCGLAALSDYSALFKNNTDMMFDAGSFCVAVVTDDAFAALSESGEVFCYAWRNADQSLSAAEQKQKADEIKDILIGRAVLTDFVKRADNQAITFTGDDMGSDKAMITWMLYIVILVLAFAFAVTTRSTIEMEASAIGTLRASGFTKGELIRHYLTLPTLASLAAAVVGNVLGYTCMKEIVVAMYYHSYSLPAYVTIWNGEAFLLTTVIPCCLILIVNLLVLSAALSLSPLQFLRHEFRKKKKKRVVKLPEWGIVSRFRLRIILQNLPAYLTMFVGILLASLMLMFGMIMSPLLTNFKSEVIHSQIAAYQYILKAPVETRDVQAEKYAVTALNLPDGGEKITVYGIQLNSQYVNDLTFSDMDGIVISDGYMEKYGLAVGDTITLQREYEKKSYSFTIAGHYPYAAALAIFMPQETFNQTFDHEAGYFSGYFSDKRLDDIPDTAIATVITQKDLTVIADQLEDSMGMMFPLFCGFAMLMYMLLIYLLSKMIVEKNSRSISMIKILGYSSREAGRLFNTTTAIMVAVSLVVSLPLCYLAMRGIYYIMMQEINGWLTFYIAPWIYFAMLSMGIVCYSIVHFLQMRRIKRIPLAQALKDME